MSGKIEDWENCDSYMKIKNKKLIEQFKEDKLRLGELTEIFRGVYVYVNGYTQPSANEIKMLMTQHGGGYSLHYSRKFTTHIIATSLAGVKLQKMRSDQIVVTPNWISDCLKQGKLLNTKPYVLATANLNKVKKSIDSHFTSSKGESTNHLAESRMSATSDKNFISEFYSRSRLHFISSWKTKLANYLKKLKESDVEMKGYSKLLEKYLHFQHEPSVLKKIKNKVIMHIDIDCFFVQASLMSHPHLKGKPIAVTHKSQSSDISTAMQDSSSYSEIASCNYEARKYGVKNGMFFRFAKQLCPDIVCIPYNFEAYEQISMKFYEVMASFTHDIQAVSCDEMFVDLTYLINQLPSQITLDEVLKFIRQLVFETTKCTCSAGVGPNILIARLATKKGKPNGQFIVKNDDVEDFISSLNVNDLPGVGRKTERKLQQIGVEFCSELKQLTLEKLKVEFGLKTGEKLYELCRGIDRRKVVSDIDRKSLSVNINYGIRLPNQAEADTFIQNCAKELSDRLKNEKVLGQKLTLKLKVRDPKAPVNPKKFGGHGICQNVSSSKNMKKPTDDADVIATESCQLLLKLKVNPVELRGIGLQLSLLTPSCEDKKLSKKKTSSSFCPSPSKSKITNFVVRSPKKLRRSNSESDIQLNNYGLKTPSCDQPSATRLTINNVQKKEKYFLSFLPEAMKLEVEQNIGLQKNLLNKVVSFAFFVTDYFETTVN